MHRGCGRESVKRKRRLRASTCAFVTVAVCVCVSLCDGGREGGRVSGSTRVNPQGDEGSVCL